MIILKLNNKGFAISSIMYLILVMALILVSLTLSLLSNRTLILESQKNKVLGEANGLSIGDIFTFESGNYSTFIVPEKGFYKIELWGSSGGGSYGGKGAYTSGIIELNSNDILYIVVGDKTGYNGGGSAPETYKIGGGASDVRLELSGDITSFNSLKSRIMVAAGGGSVVNNAEGALAGEAGGLTGFSGVAHSYVISVGDYIGYGGTQTSGGNVGADAKNKSACSSTTPCTDATMGGPCFRAKRRFGFAELFDRGNKGDGR